MAPNPRAGSNALPGGWLTKLLAHGVHGQDHVERLRERWQLFGRTETEIHTPRTPGRSSGSLCGEASWFDVEKQSDDNGASCNVKPHHRAGSARDRVGFDESRRSVEDYAGKNNSIKCHGIGELSSA
jgi:hypothetical protein